MSNHAEKGSKIVQAGRRKALIAKNNQGFYFIFLR
ncbi:hypothetical protein HDF22_003523 [Mucilaginibacter lappiensis]|uniref:Uncharacterized protein n=1 Tax=Mucilaginibacter lappiensis TaxID=354630 RepID=A0A841JEP7_9SPHI|nr:hypothetical protein [Mucilaginibacter lappiensis]